MVIPLGQSLGRRLSGLWSVAGVCCIAAIASSVAACATTRGARYASNVTEIPPVPQLADRQVDLGVAVFTFTADAGNGEAVADAFAAALAESELYRKAVRRPERIDPDTIGSGPLDCAGQDVAFVGRVTKHSAYTDGLPLLPSYGYGVLGVRARLVDCREGWLLLDLPDLVVRYEERWPSPPGLRRKALELGAVDFVQRVAATFRGGEPVASPPDLPINVTRVPQPPAGQLGPAYGRRVAAVIGINAYSGWPSLEGAVSDAQRVAAALRKRGFDEVVEIYDREATRERILKLLGIDLPTRVTDEDLVVIFFAGHGHTETLPNGEKRGYIIPVDGDRRQVFATAISMATLRDLSNRLRARHIYYAMDSCYSGLGLQRGLHLTPRTLDYIEKITSRRAVQMITAGQEGEVAIERGGFGVFTTFLLRALDGEADFDGNGYVTASEIGAYVPRQVNMASGSRQTPKWGTLEGSGEVVFSVPDRPPAR